MAISVVTIRESSGRRRQVDLVGAGLPFMGASWGGEMMMETNFNPGNPNGVQQIIVPTESPSAWEGEWNTNRLIVSPPQFSESGGSSSSVVRADTLRNIMEDIFRSGQELNVTWVAQEDRRITRVGRARTWSFKHRGPDDIAWSITFEWFGREAFKAAVSNNESLLARVRDANLASSLMAGYAESRKINSDHKDVPKGPSRFTLGQLEQLADGPRQLVASITRVATASANRLRQLTDILVTAKDQPAAIAGLLINVATTTINAANDFNDRMGRAGPEQQSNDARVASLLRALRQNNGAQTQAEFMAAENQRLARAARQRRALARPSGGASSSATASDIITVHLPKSGETMLSISRQYYDNTDFSFELSRANGLPGSTITPPRIALIIPQRSLLETQRGTGKA